MTTNRHVGAPIGNAPWLASDAVCALGEGPTWDDEAGTVRWVDIDRGVLYEADVLADTNDLGPTRMVLTVDGTLGAAVHAEGGGFLLATARHLEFRGESGAAMTTWELIGPGEQRRLNDGKCDPDGRFVVGSIPLGGLPPDGVAGVEQLWRLEHDGTVTVIDEGIALSNGMAWSPDGRVMYNVDTMMHRVYARSYNPDTGDVGAATVLIETGTSLPDGLAVDSAGDLWIAMWGEAEIRRFRPDGTLRGALRTGVQHTTSCAFVGPNLDVLVVTSAGAGAAAGALDGRLLARRGSWTGLPTRAWRPCANLLPQ